METARHNSSNDKNVFQSSRNVILHVTHIEGAVYKTRGTLNPTWIAIHYPGVSVSSALTVAKSLARPSSESSTHFVVDDKEIVACLPCDKVAWHVTNGKPDQRYKNAYFDQAVVNHANWDKKYPWTSGMRGNSNAIGVDLCSTCRTEDRSASSEGWEISDGTLANGAMLVAYLMVKYGIGIDFVVRHGDLTGKPCPRPFVPLKSETGTKREEIEKRWSDFKDRVERLAENSFTIKENWRRK